MILTAVNYAVLTGYDFLAFAYLGRSLPWRRVAVASFVAYAISNNVGFGMLSGASVRYRFYTRWGLTADELTRIVFSYVGHLLARPPHARRIESCREPAAERAGAARRSSPPVGWVLVLASLGYVAAAFLLPPIRFRRFELRLPSPTIAVAQLAISVLDWVLAGAVLYVLLPPSGLPFLPLLGAFLASQLLALASHVPGGMGVFEGLMVLLLKPSMPAMTLLPALIVYRAVYYLFPLAVALLILVTDELRQRRSQAAWVGATLRLAGGAAHAASARLLHVPGRGRSPFLRCDTRRRRSARIARSCDAARASSKRRISPAVWSVRRCCCSRRGWRGGWTPRTS